MAQATLELLARSRRAPFMSREHVLHALEQKFRSRIDDRRRAIGGRSAIESAIAQAVPVDGIHHVGDELEDHGAGVERQVFARSEMRRMREAMADLSRDQQLVLASQACADMEPAEFCARYGWSAEKYRKVAQRGRGRLRLLVEEYELGERCRRLEPDLLALSAGVAEGAALGRARAHVENCTGCARMVGRLERSTRSVAALLPLPGGAAGGGWLGARLAGLPSGLRRLAGTLRHPLAQAGGSGGAGVAGSSLAGASAGALKVGIAAICMAGTVGGYAACARLAGLAGGAPTPLHHGGGAPRTLRHAGAHTGDRRDGAPIAVTRAGSPSRPATAAVRLATAPSRQVRVSAIVQIRREFGVPAARAATGSTTPTAPPDPAPSRAQTPVQATQTAAEFGLER